MEIVIRRDPRSGRIPYDVRNTKYFEHANNTIVFLVYCIKNITPAANKLAVGVIVINKLYVIMGLRCYTIITLMLRR